MAINTSYINNVSYTPTMDVNLNKSIMGTKTIIGDNNSLKVNANSTPNMGVKVNIGKCWINGYFIENTASVSLSIAGNTSGYSRIDAVVIEGGSSGGSIKIEQGQASAFPSAPPINSNQIKLAEVTVVNNATAIQTANIKDTRNSVNMVTSLDELVFDINTRVTTLENGRCVKYTNRTQTDDYILMTNLFEFKDTGLKLSNMTFYCNANYLAKTKPNGQSVSIITLPYYFAIGEHYNVQISVENGQINGKYDGQIKFSKPTSSGFTIYLPNKNNDNIDVTLHILAVGK